MIKIVISNFGRIPSFDYQSFTEFKNKVLIQEQSVIPEVEILLQEDSKTFEILEHSYHVAAVQAVVYAPSMRKDHSRHIAEAILKFVRTNIGDKKVEIIFVTVENNRFWS